MKRPKTVPTLVDLRGEAVAIGGAFDGVDKLNRETVLWQPSMRSPDAAINVMKPLADARGRDTVRNDGYASGASAIHKDSVIGNQFRLNCAPDLDILSQFSAGFDEVWADEFQQVMEARFNAFGESNQCWLDASRVNTFTGMMRLAVGMFLVTGEVLGTVEWVRESDRPLNTTIQLVSPDRLCNPQGLPDNRYLRRGVERDLRGKPLIYHIRRGDRLDYYPDDFAFTWDSVPVAKPWGRKQVLHIIEQQSPDQTRGVSEMVAALKNMRMTKTFQEVTLQNAVINATYAAAIESELPSDAISAALGSTAGDGDIGNTMLGVYNAYMSALGSYLGAANNIRVDGAQIPHLFPGTKLTMQPAKTAGGVGTNFEESLQRHTAAALGLSYEEFSRDFSKTNYSSGRAALGLSGRYMAARKRHVADRMATDIWSLVLEEDMSNGNVPLPARIRRDVFYRPLAKEAFTTCTWLGAGSGQIDELKETQAAILRIGAGLTTWEQETARLGLDWRKTFNQRKREEDLIKSLGLDFNLAVKKPTGQQVSSANLDENGQTSTGDTTP